MAEGERRPRREGAETKIRRARLKGKTTAGYRGGEEWHEYYCFFRGEDPQSRYLHSGSQETSRSDCINTQEKSGAAARTYGTSSAYPLTLCTP